MTKEINERKIRLGLFNKYFPATIAMGLFGAIAVPWYVATSQREAHDEFFKNPVVTLEAKVIGERYVQPSTSPSKYFISVEDPLERRGTVEVIDANGVGVSYGIESPITKESVDAKVGIGTRVKIKAREVGPLEYKAFAHEITEDARGR